MASESRVTTIRRWLMTGTKPAAIEVTNANNEVKRVTFGFGDTWIAVARTIDAFEPVRLCAYDTDNNILRASLMTSLLDIDPEDTASDATTGTAPRGPLSSNEQMLVTFATLIAKAYENSSNIAWNTAFQKMVEIADIQGRRAEAIESRLARMESLFNRTFAQQVSNATDQEPDLLSQIVGAYVQGAAAAHAGKPGPTNGKGAPQI